MDTLSKDLLGGLGKMEGAIKGVGAVKAKMRTLIKDYRSVLQVLQSSTPSVLQHELERLQGLLKEIEDLHDKVTAGPDDGRLARIAKRLNRGVKHEAIAEALDAIDREVVRQFAAIGAKCSINPQAMDTILSRLRPPPLPDMAAVPAGALALPPSFVERSGVRAAVDGLLDQDKALAPFSVVGMGGAGKTVLASAVVRQERVRKHFRGGIFWLRVGRGAKRHLQPLLEGLSREMGAAPTDSSHIVPHVFDGLEHVKQHLAAVASKGSSPRLVVLDDVWEREVVDALLAVGTKLLVTTRDHSVVGGPGCRFELGNMTEDEALELLLKTSMTAGQPGNDIRTQMIKVFDLCGGVPLVLAIAGSMPIVKGKGLTAGAWAELIETLTNVATKMETSGEELDSLGMVLETSFNALAGRKKGQLKRLAVLATGVVVPVAMLRNLWEIQDEEGTREEAEGLVGKCLLQDLGAARYRAHDLVLEFLKMKVKADANLAKKIAALQAQYLRRLDVLRRYLTWEHGAGNQSWFSLAALWRSAEELSGNPQLQVESYRASLKEAEARAATAAVEGSISSIRVSMRREAGQASTSSADDLQQDVVLFGADATKALSSMAVDALERFYSSVGCLFMLEGKYAEAEPLTKRALTILENTVGAEHSRVAAALKTRAELLMRQRKDAEAGPLHERSQALQEKLLGPEHPNVAILLGIRAHVLQNQGKFAEAEPLLERSEEILEKTVGPGDPAMVTSLLARASSLDAQGKFAEAEHLYERSKTIQEKAFGPAHPAVAIPLNKLASMLVSQGEHARAEPLFERSLAIQEKYLGSDHPEVADSLNSMALLLFEQRKLTAAKPLFERSLAIREKVFGPEHRNVATSLNNLAGVLEVQEKYAEAARLFERSYGILEKALDPEHPTVAATLNNWAHLLVLQGKYAEAEPRHKRALAIREKVLGPEDRSVARSLDDLAFLLARQGKYSESEAMYKRSIAILEKVFGPEHQRVVSSLMGCADVLNDQGKSAEAKHLRDRSLVILEKVVRREYPDEYHRLSSHLTSDWSGGESRSVTLKKPELPPRCDSTSSFNPRETGTAYTSLSSLCRGARQGHVLVWTAERG
ncbi:unnamed protein product [Scytosiphon promiscuus]